ncbi:MAG: alpha/beta fold hydrolase, partial [Cyanobacteria bacterium J06598_3]
YEDVWIPIAGDKIHGWWIPAEVAQPFTILPNEPVNILPEPKTILYFCGVGNNMGDYNYLARMSAFRQLGFLVLAFDYRGYGRSGGDFPHETQLYEDAEVVWDYLRESQGIPAEQIVIYGESMGGAIALDLAIKHPDANALIMQSSFTSMAEAINARPATKVFPVNSILSERFESLDKIDGLKMPVLFLHGQVDSVIPAEMSQRLHDATPTPYKQLFLIPNADHVSIYQPGSNSYLRAIQRLMISLPR